MAAGAASAAPPSFDLHARVAIATDQAGGVGRLEKLVRYCARPPLANDRLSLQLDGHDASRLKPSSLCSRGDWAALMRRAFGYDLLACSSCGGKMVYLCCVLRRDVITKILARAEPGR